MIDWKRLFELIQELLKEVGVDPTDPTHWKVSVDGAPSGPVTKSIFGTAGVDFGFTHQSAAHTLEGKPQPGNHALVEFDGQTDQGAHMTFAVRDQFPAKPLILVIEFVDVALGGAKRRIRFDCPK